MYCAHVTAVAVALPGNLLFFQLILRLLKFFIAERQLTLKISLHTFSKRNVIFPELNKMCASVLCIQIAVSECGFVYVDSNVPGQAGKCHS